jgi:hypothetical protein
VISREDAVNEAGERIEKPKYKSALITALVNGYQQLRSQLRGQLRARLRRRITEHFAPRRRGSNGARWPARSSS